MFFKYNGDNMEENFEFKKDKYGNLSIVQKIVKVETKNIKDIKNVEVKKPVFKGKALNKKK